jgi:hypothetical protein
MRRIYPTSPQINRPPLPVRRYIHDLETRSDPAGDLRRLAEAEMLVASLAATVKALEQQLSKAPTTA